MSYKAKTYYQNKEVANRYYKKRFTTASGRINHFIEKSFLARLIRNLGIEKALDVACGTGRLTLELAKCGIPRITGVDISEEMMEVAKQYCLGSGAEINFRKGDATSLPFNSSEYDLVISYRFLDHLPPEEKLEAISEMIRVSKRYIVFTLANINVWTELARKLRKIIHKQYYEGFLMAEDEITRFLREHKVRIRKRRLKAPLVSMEVMYFCEKY